MSKTVIVLITLAALIWLDCVYKLWILKVYLIHAFSAFSMHYFTSSNAVYVLVYVL